MFGRIDEMDSLRQRIAELERLVALQQHQLTHLCTELDVASPVPSALIPEASGLHPEVLDHLRSGRDIAAIRRYRELTGVGLRDAKDRIDEEKRTLGL